MTLTLQVVSTANETALIRRIVLRRAEGGNLPGFEAGSHITLRVPDVGPRKYSLINASPVAGATAAPESYSLGVRLDADGGGGSRFVHALRVGDIIHAEPPQNDFPLDRAATAPLLIAGGIGVTPLIAMAAELRAADRPFRFIYAARQRSEFAFAREIEGLAGTAAVWHADDEAGGVFDVAAALASLGAGQQAYMCGPKPMLKAGIAASRHLGWSPGRLRFELFYSAADAAVAPKATTSPDDSFEVELKSTGQIFRVPKDKSIVDVLVDAGIDVLHDCKRGECGVCQVGVVSGTPDHRDVILSDSERAAGKVMQICISRSKSSKLVLDL